jgi:hypothetical protein
MRHFINLVENAQEGVVSADDLVRMFPGIEDDLAHVGEWVHEPTFRLKIEPMDLFRERAEHLLSTYPEFPRDKARTNKIVRELKAGAPQRPIFCEAEAFSDEDSFIMEGRHRIVAFYLTGCETVPVVYVSDASR